MASQDAHTAYPAEVYESFDAFMQQIIRDTYERGAKRPEFVALILASGELIPMAWGRVKQAGVRDLALGAAGVVALRYGIRWLLGGPLGVILTGFTVATMISFFWSNQREVLARRKPYKQLIADTHEKYEDIQARYRDSRYDAGERALLIEGLLRRLLSEIEKPISDDKTEAEADDDLN
ncbi:hypothetical protein G6O69_33130 [Pseudenhygromyxa sp. WMMC2535]|uniref:hypothetical protein n=1 Tax=Pseudenhygromyxa sp. WMMC2535 TaxID=2712867 RepID=UPI0015573E01|nr:hypothetical protein [Pseudenhygromyxa sp. WMMC2535]NVB42712.1 hypothetical protein [Pseudenhygromyxa sp. WMMC2535]